MLGKRDHLHDEFDNYQHDHNLQHDDQHDHQYDHNNRLLDNGVLVGMCG